MWPGATAAASKMNFVQWLDAIIQGLARYNVLVYAGANREWSLYHQIMMYKFLEITTVFSSAFTQWGNECTANGESCTVVVAK